MVGLYFKSDTSAILEVLRYNVYNLSVFCVYTKTIITGVAFLKMGISHDYTLYTVNWRSNISES